MSLALALNNALTGLNVNQQSISVLSQNIANVNTSGYSRQIVNQSAVVVEGLGSGVQIDDIAAQAAGGVTTPAAGAFPLRLCDQWSRSCRLKSRHSNGAGSRVLRSHPPGYRTWIGTAIRH